MNALSDHVLIFSSIVANSLCATEISFCKKNVICNLISTQLAEFANTLIALGKIVSVREEPLVQSETVIILSLMLSLFYGRKIAGNLL